VNAAWSAGVALLMISRVPTVSLKPIRHSRTILVMPTLLGIGVSPACSRARLATLTLSAALRPRSVTVRAYYRLRRAAEARKAEAPSPPRYRFQHRPAIPIGAISRSEWRIRK